MNLGIQGRRALVCAASSGLGQACALALAQEGADVAIVGRDAGRLEQAAARIAQQTGAAVAPLVADLSDPAACTALLARSGVPDILVTNCAGPQLAGLQELAPAHWAAALDALFLGPLALIQGSLAAMAARGFGRVVNISSAAVLAPRPGFALSCAPRAALMAFCALAAREMAAHNVTINQLLPHAIETDRLAANWRAEAAARQLDPAELRRQRTQDIPAARTGTPAEFGAYCAFLCSTHAGYVTGRNHLLDGGALQRGF